jgi:glucose-6-phosphate isomerase
VVVSLFSEDRPVLHHLLRLPENYVISNRHGNYKQIYHGAGNRQTSQEKAEFDLLSAMKDVHQTRARMKVFVDQVRSGDLRSVVDKPFRNFLVIGIGGFSLGPDMIATALEADPEACRGARGFTLRFLSNLDPVDFYSCTKDLDPAETMVIVSNKTFTETECMVNARTARYWLIRNLDGFAESTVVARHMVGISSNATRCAQFGISTDSIFLLPEWVIGRFSLCSAAGLLPLSLYFSFDVMSDFLAGCHDMDEHFFNAPPPRQPSHSFGATGNLEQHFSWPFLQCHSALQ